LCGITQKGPKVTIIIPHYNQKDCRQRLLPSVDDQTYRDFEVLMVALFPKMSDSLTPLSCLALDVVSYIDPVEVHDNDISGETIPPYPCIS
jgi:hypothetical protein